MHDWPDDEAYAFLGKAADALQPGGTIMIFERAPLRIVPAVTAVSMIPNLLTFRSYRPAGLYMDHLAALGFAMIQSVSVELDSTFSIITGRKPLG